MVVKGERILVLLVIHVLLDKMVMWGILAVLDKLVILVQQAGQVK